MRWWTNQSVQTQGTPAFWMYVGTQDKCTLKNHMTRHTGEKAYACHLCDRTFSLKQTKETHIKSIHEEASRFRCDYVDCTYGSEYRRQLETHKIKHTGEKEKVSHVWKSIFTGT